MDCLSFCKASNHIYISLGGIVNINVIDKVTLLVLTQTNPVCRGLPVDPEGHPGEDHYEGTGHVHLDQEVSHVALQAEAHRQGRELSCGEDKYNRVYSRYKGHVYKGQSVIRDRLAGTESFPFMAVYISLL